MRPPAETVRRAAPSSIPRGSGRAPEPQRGRKYAVLAYVIPALVLLGVFVYYPLIANLVFSFFEFRAGAGAMEFVGLDNFAKLAVDPVIRTALANNALYAVVSVVFQVFGGLVLAAWLTHLVRERIGAILRSIYFLPVIISITVVGLLFTFIYDARNGLLNSFLAAVGLEDLQRAWLADTGTAMLSVIAVSQWQSVGYICMLFVVALQQIPVELYEAAQLDGAGKIRQFFSVTVPQAKEMIFVSMILTVTGAFTVFNEVYILTRGGPGNTTQVLSTYMYNQGFFQNQMGYASAIASLIFVITVIISIVQMVGFRSGKDD